MTIMLNLLFGLLFFNIGDTSRADYNITSHFGALVMIGMSGMMGAAQVRVPLLCDCAAVLYALLCSSPPPFLSLTALANAPCAPPPARRRRCQ